uniref:Protein arginine N-methyltransferase n=1 Tax=Clastoptera arizonana TaxID=38151 RepID=A0A1B6CG41_9HEMI
MITSLNSRTLGFLFKKSIQIINKMNVFTKKMNFITGETNWVVQNEEYDFHQEISRSAFADMLHDKERNDKYYLAIKSAIDFTHKSGKKATVLDIGTGTGLLSMMAAQCGADHIFACEAFSPIAKTAIQVIKDNGYSDRIKVIGKRSTELTVGINADIPFLANILVAEVFDTELIGEGALPTFSHAVKNLLEKDCVVVPAFGTIYAQVVEGDFIQNWNKIKPIESVPDQFINPSEKLNLCKGQNAVHDLQLSQLDQSRFKTISAPQQVLRFDWSGKTIPLKKTSQTILHIKAETSGTAQAVLMWWDLDMDPQGSIVLSCAPWWAHPDNPTNPSSIPWRDHWLQAIYYLPESLKINKNEEFQLVSSHDEFSLWFQVDSVVNDQSKPLYSCPQCQCGLHLMSRTRIGMLNDNYRRLKYREVLKELITPKSVVVTFGDFCLLGLQAAKMGAKQVYCVEENRLICNIVEDFVKNNKLEQKVIILNSSSLEKEVKSNITLVLAEPYFQSTVLPWDVLRFWYLLKQFDQVKVVPQSISLCALPLKLDNLYKIRQPVNMINNFKIRIFDHLVQKSSEISDDMIETQPLWEYPGIALSMPKKLIMFDMQSQFPTTTVIRKEEIKIDSAGECNGVALWLDFHLDGNNTISQGPTNPVTPGTYVKWDIHTRQGIYFPHHPISLSKNDHLTVKISFNPVNGDVNFTFNTNTTR